jgi:hypothetical protein
MDSSDKSVIGHRMHSRTSLHVLKLSGIAIFVFFTALTSRGATYSAASPDVTAIQSKINLAHDGDIVVVPAGTAHWTETLEITKNITVRGAGIGRTVIYDEVPRAPQVHTIRVVLSKNLPFRLTGFDFRGDATVTKSNGGGVFRFRGMHGVTSKFRLDHCSFSDLHGLPLVIQDVTGVVDHCTVETPGGEAMQVYHNSWGGENYGHGSWADYPYWGSDNFLFIEDCSFMNGTIDCYEGARVVLRHNTFQDGQVTSHGTEGQGRGAKQLEIYNNVFTFSLRHGGAQIRSGTVLVHDNTCKNFTDGLDLRAYRQVEKRGSWGISSGSNPWDLNSSVLGAVESGTHTGADAATTLVDSNKSWTPDEWETVASRKGFTYIIRNVSKNRQSVIMSNTQKSVTYFLKVPPLRFEHGDTYQIWKVVSTLDQPGQGKSDLLSGLPAFPKQWPHNTREPCYSWNNKDEAGRELDLHSPHGSIQEGRDYYNRTRKPNYAPYIYPHPLTAAN